jgi:hypothetical protein
MARAALTSDTAQKGEGSKGRSHIPQGMAGRCRSERVCTERRLARAGGRGRRLKRRPEVSRVDHVTVDNAVLDAPKGRSARNGARSGSQSWRRGVNHDPPGWKPTLPGGPLERGTSGLHTQATGASPGQVWRGTVGAARARKLAPRVRSRSRSTGESHGAMFGSCTWRGSRGATFASRVAGGGRGRSSERTRTCDPPGAERPAGARFFESRLQGSRRRIVSRGLGCSRRSFTGTQTRARGSARLDGRGAAVLAGQRAAIT